MTGSPAIIKAQEIHDRPGDLAPYQQEFLQAVHRATMECVRTKEAAITALGDGSRAYNAVAYLADSKQLNKLADALKRYEQALEDT